MPPWFKAGVMFGSAALGFLGAELVVRAGSGGALPHLRLFVQQGERIGLEAGGCADVRHAAGHEFTVCADARGHRTPSAAAGAWLVVGDSQVLGMGVDGAQSFPALNGWTNAGVPGHGVGDALRVAETQIETAPPAGLVVVVNQANDWDEALVPASERYRVAGGLLLRAETASALGETFWNSPLSHLHLLSYVALLASAPRVAADAAPPAWMANPTSQAGASAALADAIRSFSERHPGLSVVAAFLPVDVATDEQRVPSSPFGRYVAHTSPAPWEDHTLRDQIRDALSDTQVRFVDLGEALRATPHAFLDADYHLSPAGHEAVAAHLREATR
ncbi:MAG: hypothetical protein VX265_03480 [Myxococcota bacterium]|nr:hypothetical protein [Myxococcota bacterium]